MKKKLFVLSCVMSILLTYGTPFVSAQEKINSQQSNISGEPDPTFGIKGITNIDLGVREHRAYDSVVDPAGNILVAGVEIWYESNAYHSIYAIIKYKPDGTLDDTFGSNGKVTTIFSTNLGCSAHSIALSTNPDGTYNIFVGGTTSYPEGTSTKSQFALAKYNQDGQLDSTFGNGGKVTTNVSSPYGFDFGRSVAIQQDGKIVLSGYVLDSNAQYDPAIVRYNANGILDITFDGDGKAIYNITNNEERVSGITLQSDGKMIVFGESIVNSARDMFIMRANSNGTLDATFNDTGILVMPVSSSNEYVKAISLQSSKIIIGGYVSPSSGSSHAVVMRFNSDGSIDNTFGVNGKTVINEFTVVGDLKVYGNGKIILGGKVVNNSGDDPIILAKLTESGQLDSTFGNSGIVITPITSNPSDYNENLLTAISIDNNSRIIAAGISGYTISQPSSTQNIFVARYLNTDLNCDC